MKDTTSTRRGFLTMGMGALCHAAEPKAIRPAFNTLSDAEEVALGRRFAASLEKQMPILEVGPLDAYVNNLVTRLGKTSRRANLKYVAKVVNTTDVNAVSMAGGFIYVFRGLLETARSESELAGVLSHEVGHVVGRHAANQLMLNFRARQLYELVKQNLELRNTVIEQVIEKLGGAVVMLANLKYDREQEFEADLFGFYNMIRAGWNPEGLSAFFRRANMTSQGGGNWMDDMMSTHPSPADRIRRLTAEAQIAQMPQGLDDNSMSFQAMKLGLKLLPAPVRPRRKQ